MKKKERKQLLPMQSICRYLLHQTPRLQQIKYILSLSVSSRPDTYYIKAFHQWTLCRVLVIDRSRILQLCSWMNESNTKSVVAEHFYLLKTKTCVNGNLNITVSKGSYCSKLMPYEEFTRKNVPCCAQCFLC